MWLQDRLNSGQLFRVAGLFDQDLQITFSTSPTWLVTFSNNSTNATSYKWIFGDGSESTHDSAAIHHYYFSPATCQVSLVANGNSASDTLTLPVVIP